MEARCRLLGVLLLVSLLAHRPASGDTVEWQPVGRLVGGRAYDVAVKDDAVYLAAGSLRLIDVSTRSHPFQIGPSLGGGHSVLKEGDYLYVAAGSLTGSCTFTVFDVSDAMSPAQLGACTFSCTFQVSDDRGDMDIAVGAGYAYLAVGTDGLRVIDVRDPAHPAPVGGYDTPGLARGVAASGGYAYIADYDAGLRIVNVSDPTNPTEVAHLDTPSSLHYFEDIAFAGGHVYVTGSGVGLVVIDVSVPADPRQVAHNTETSGKALTLEGTFIYVVGNEFTVYDISEPTNPVSMGECGLGRFVVIGSGVAVADGYAYVAADSNGLAIISVSDPQNPVHVGQQDAPEEAQDVAVSGGYAYVAEYYLGLTTIDVADPAKPLQIGYGPTSGSCYQVAVSGSYAYVVDDSLDFLRVVDLSDVTQPQEVGSWAVPWGTPIGVAISGSYAYVACRAGELWVLDISTPAQPVEVGYCSLPDAKHGLVVSGAYAYVPAYRDGLRVIDVSDPTDPHEVGYWVEAFSSYAFAVAVSGGYAYVANGAGGLLVLDVSDPTAPRELGWASTGGEAIDVALFGQYAYVADARTGLRVMDVSDPADPVEVAYYPSGPYGLPMYSGLAAGADGHIYLCLLAGIWVFPPFSSGSLVADFIGSPLIGPLPLEVTFSDQSAGAPTTWLWSFGDGASSSQHNPSHTYEFPGIYEVSLTASNASESDTSIKTDYVAVYRYPDVLPGSWAFSSIEACVTADIVQGYPDGTYRPSDAVSRDQMAVYIARALAGGDDSVPAGPAEATFNDVPTDYWAYDHVEYCFGNNVVQGYDPVTYAPTVEVTRDQMAVYVARALVAPTGEAALADYVPADPRDFPDVAADFWAYTHIEYCVENGVVQGYDDGYYHPDYVVTRDQMAVYVARAFGLVP